MEDKGNSILIVRRLGGETYLVQGAHIIEGPSAGNWRMHCHGPGQWYDVRETTDAFEEAQDMLVTAQSARKRERERAGRTDG